jgi:hypothetical protein
MKFERWLHTTRVAESTRYTKGTYSPIMPKKLLMLMSMNTGSLSRVKSIMAANVDLNDSGRDRQGQRSAAKQIPESNFRCHNLYVQDIIFEFFRVTKQNACTFLDNHQCQYRLQL